MIRKLFSHSIIYGLAPQVGTVAGVIALPIITRDLTETDFGVWGIVLAYVGAFNALADMGMGVVVSNAFFKKPKQHKWLWRQIYGFLHLWMIPFNIIIGALLWLIMPTEALNDRIWILVGLLLPNLLFGPTIVFGTYYYQLGQKPTPIAIRSAIFGVLTVALNVWFISNLKLGYMGWLWSHFITRMLMNISFWYPLNIQHGYSPILNFKWRTIKKSLKVGVPTIPHQYSTFLLNSSDRIVLDRLRVSVENLGEYNLAARFGTYFQSLVIASNRAVSPMMLDCYKKGKDVEARNLIFVLQVTVISATFLFCLWAREIFQLLIKNEALAKVYPLAIIIVMAYNYRPMYIGALNKLFYVEKTGLLWRVSFVAGIGNIVLNFIFIPIFGFHAAAYTTFASLMYMGFYGHFSKKISAYQEANYYPVFWFLLIVVMTVVVFLLKDSTIILKVSISLVFSACIGTVAWKYGQWQKTMTS